MRDLLSEGYTIFISKKDNKINGVGLRKLNNGKGIEPRELDENKIKVLGELPNLGKKLDEGLTLQVHRSYEEQGIRYIAQIGQPTKEGPYSEEDCFRVSYEAIDEEFLGAIILLDDEIRKNESKDTPPKKLVRSYGEVTYK